MSAAAREYILKRLPCKPTELYPPITEADIHETVIAMVADGEIELTRKRILKLRAAPQSGEAEGK